MVVTGPPGAHHRRRPQACRPASSQAFAKLPMQATTRWGLSTVTSLPASSVKVTGPACRGLSGCGSLRQRGPRSPASCWERRAARRNLTPRGPQPTNARASAAVRMRTVQTSSKQNPFDTNDSQVQPKEVSEGCDMVPEIMARADGPSGLRAAPSPKQGPRDQVPCRKPQRQDVQSAIVRHERRVVGRGRSSRLGRGCRRRGSRRRGPGSRRSRRL